MHKKSLIDKAIEVAALAHQGQVRKHTDIPYISHPFGVAMILSRYGYSEVLITAGLLHDVVEDTDLSLGDISRIFDDDVTTIVYGCSEPDKSQPWMVRKSQTIESLRSAPRNTKIVVCADKLHNILSIAADYEEVGEKVWDRFNAGKSNQEWYYKHLIKSFASEPESLESHPLFQEFKREVESLFRPKS